MGYQSFNHFIRTLLNLPFSEGNPGDTIGCFRLPNIDSLQTPHYVANNTLAKHVSHSNRYVDDEHN